MRSVEVKIYPNKQQAGTLMSWMGICCGIYNRALEHRIKAYSRRGESIGFYKQSSLLTCQRKRIKYMQSVPLVFCRDAIRRVDRGMNDFFRRIKSGAKPGFPRFRPRQRYRSIEALEVYNYIKKDSKIHIPGIGRVRFRTKKQAFPDTQKLLRVIHRPSGWYAQVVFSDDFKVSGLSDVGPIGIDMGIASLAALSDGTEIENPRFYAKSQRKLRSLHRRASRKMKGSKNRRKAVKRLARHHERVVYQRRSFCHEHSTRLIRNHSVIVIEKLDVSRMTRGLFAKYILDAGWGRFIGQLRLKAANAGRKLIEVDARYTSQTCPECGNIKKKELSERVHACKCGCILDRDVAAAKVILSRALDGNRGVTPVEEPTSVPLRVAA